MAIADGNNDSLALSFANFVLEFCFKIPRYHSSYVPVKELLVKKCFKKKKKVSINL